MNIFSDLFSPEKAPRLSREGLNIILDRSRVRRLAEEAITARFIKEYPVDIAKIQRGAEVAVAQTEQEAYAKVAEISAAAGRATMHPSEETGQGPLSVSELTRLAEQLATSAYDSQAFNEAA